MGRLDAIYHDSLSRCADTALLLKPNVLFEAPEAGPWNMGELFEGREITEDSLNLARYYVENNLAKPPRGEQFATYYDRWMCFLVNLKHGHSAVGIVTHNRNIQTVYASQYGRFEYQMYDCDGPGFCSVHYYDQRTGLIAPWGGKNVPNGIYLIRHGETSWGT